MNNNKEEIKKNKTLIFNLKAKISELEVTNEKLDN